MFYVITLTGARGAVKLQCMSDAAAPSRKPRDAYHHGGLRDALVDAAIQAAEAGGPEAVSFTALARALGVTQAAPYRHFADRDELLAAAATGAFRLMQAELRRAVARPSRRTPLARLARAYLAFGTRRVGLYRLMYAGRLIERAPVGSELQRTVEDGFLETLDLFGPPEADAARQRIALKLWASIHGVVMLADQGMLPLKVRKLTADDLVDEFVRDTEALIAAARR